MLISLGCKKEDVITTTPIALTKSQILVKYTWQLEEVLRNSSGKNSRYIKGVTNTTGFNYSVVRITFKADGTGTYTNDLGQTSPSTWKFTSADEKNMEFSVSSTTLTTYIWNFVEIADRVLNNTTAITGGTTDLLVSCTLYSRSLVKIDLE